MRVTLIILLIALGALARTPNNADRVLILYDNVAVFATHSILFDTLSGSSF